MAKVNEITELTNIHEAAKLTLESIRQNRELRTKAYRLSEAQPASRQYWLREAKSIKEKIEELHKVYSDLLPRLELAPEIEYEFQLN